MAPSKVFLASVFDRVLREPILNSCRDAVWQPEMMDRGERTIEDWCRDLIRRSSAFVAVFDGRGGRALAFAGVQTPVTVLEIELMQALFQRMPVHIFTLSGFSENDRLRGLVDLAGGSGLARVTKVDFSIDSGERLVLPSHLVRRIQRLVRSSTGRLWHWRVALASRFRRFELLNTEFLAGGFDVYRDSFDPTETARLIDAAVASKDHAAHLAMLWAAMRQLCSVPYTREEFIGARSLWERALSEWVRSAAWYGLHDDSPISLLAAVNSVIAIRSRAASGLMAETSPHHIHGSRGARASALYSMAKKTWRWQHRRELLRGALADVEMAIATNPSRLSSYLAIRGSILRALGRLRHARADHERMVALRRSESPDHSSLGEALTELGWTCACGLCFGQARRHMAEGIALMRRSKVDNPAAAGFQSRALRKFAIIQTLTLNLRGAKEAATEARQLAQDYLVRDQLRAF